MSEVNNQRETVTGQIRKRNTQQTPCQNLSDFHNNLSLSERA